MRKNRHSKQDKKHEAKLTKDVGKVLTKLVKPDNPIVKKRIIKNDGSPITTVNEDEKGKLVLTPEDMVKRDNILSLQAKALQAKIDKKAIDDKLKEATQAIAGSPALSALRQDIEARLKAQEDVTEKALTVYQEAKDKLQAIQSEYQALTGIDKKVKASKGKSKTGNGNGKFETTLKQKDDCISVLVTHKKSKSLFEYSLYPKNGSISKEDWLKLRHSLTAQFERETKEENLTIRAYLSNLKTKIESIKAIA